MIRKKRLIWAVFCGMPMVLLVFCVRMPQLAKKEYVYDQAGLTNVLSRVNSSGMFVDDPNCLWSDGSITMPNPFGWNEDSTSGETPPYDTFAESTIDIVELRFDGRCRIWKLGNEVIRYPSGSVYLNGEFQ